MKKVKCVSIRGNFPKQIQIGNIYYIDENSKYIDNDGDEYAVISLDPNSDNKIGNLLTSHFNEIFE